MHIFLYNDVILWDFSLFVCRKMEGKISHSGLLARSPEGHAARGMPIKGNEDVWVEIQANTFRNWVNEHLPKELRIADLSEVNKSTLPVRPDVAVIFDFFAGFVHWCQIVRSSRGVAKETNQTSVE